MGAINLTLPRHISLKEKAIFARQLATMLGAGLHLTRSIEIVAKQTHNRYFKQVIESIYQSLEEGKSFSTLLARYPDVFDKVFVNVVRAGEQSGQLELVLSQLAKQLNQQYLFIGRLKSALIYPVFVLMVMIGVAILATVKIIPQLKPVFEESKLELPATTRFVLGASDFIINYWYVIILVVIFAFVLVKVSSATEQGGLLVDQFILRDPAGLAKRVYMARFTRTLGMLLAAGIPIVEAVKIVAEVVGNRIYKSLFLRVAGELERGVPMSVPMQRSPYLPVFVSQMIVVGEQTGQLDKVLIGLADFYEEEAETGIRNIAQLFEPIIIVVIGVGIGFLVYSIIIPIYNLAQAQ